MRQPIKQTKKQFTMKTITLIFGMVAGLALGVTAQDTTRIGNDITIIKEDSAKRKIVIEYSEESVDSIVQAALESIAADSAAPAPSERKSRKKRPNNVWAGFDLGVNALITPEGSFSLTGQASPFELDYAKSISFAWNLYEYTIPIAKNNFYLSTGIGFEWNNYRFEDRNMAINKNFVEGNIIQPFPLPEPDYTNLTSQLPDSTRQYTKNKLVTAMLNVPLLFTVAVNKKSGKQAAHLTLGGIVGWRYNSRQKFVFVEEGDRQVTKTRDDFGLNPFRFSATARLGAKNWGLFANYAFNPLFQDRKGPAMHPLTMGFSLIFG